MLWDGAACCHYGERAKGGWSTVGDSGSVPDWSPGLYRFVTAPLAIFYCRVHTHSNIQNVLNVVEGSFMPIKFYLVIIVSSHHLQLLTVNSFLIGLFKVASPA